MQHPGVPPSAQPPPVFSLPTTASGMPSLPSSPGLAAGPRAVPAASPNRATSFRAPEGEPASEPDNALVPVEKDLGAPYAFNPTTGMLETPGGGISGAVLVFTLEILKVGV